ncbi:calcium-binding protein PBP1 isoform X1 [Cannabis sativa]|uniref:EF-hand domain-containing protein n=2 Tax=Cannabis sativa TaxID=3483 RepID=A0A803QCP4_CANSA|nr:calcium-binding protein PBP1 isoform X1 [Cannabis sativa]
MQAMNITTAAAAHDQYHHQLAASIVDFEDYFPSMIGRLGAEGFIWELCNGFRLLMDVEKGVITFESLKRNSYLLGLQELRDDDLVCMLMEGDLDGDGALNQMEFCVLMFRLSPGLMDNNMISTTNATTANNTPTNNIINGKQCWTDDNLEFNHLMNNVLI